MKKALVKTFNHLLPYSWLYKSKAYLAFSIVIPILSLIVGLKFEPYLLAAMMVVVEILFTLCLIIENKNLKLHYKVERDTKTEKVTLIKN